MTSSMTLRITSSGDRIYIDRMVKDSSQDSCIAIIRPRRPEPILVCRKCLKRVANGKNIKRALKAEVRRRSVAQAAKRPRIVLTDCFDICPKRAVVLASGTTLHRNEYLLLAGDNQIEGAVAILMPPDRALSRARDRVPGSRVNGPWQHKFDRM
jgi:hypothetical protein